MLLLVVDGWMNHVELEGTIPETHPGYMTHGCISLFGIKNTTKIHIGCFLLCLLKLVLYEDEEDEDDKV